MLNLTDSLPFFEVVFGVILNPKDFTIEYSQDSFHTYSKCIINLPISTITSSQIKRLMENLPISTSYTLDVNQAGRIFLTLMVNEREKHD